MCVCVCVCVCVLYPDREDLCGDSFNRSSNKVLFCSLLLLFVVLTSCVACRLREKIYTPKEKKKKTEKLFTWLNCGGAFVLADWTHQQPQREESYFWGQCFTRWSEEVDFEPYWSINIYIIILIILFTFTSELIISQESKDWKITFFITRQRKNLKHQDLKGHHIVTEKKIKLWNVVFTI